MSSGSIAWNSRLSQASMLLSALPWLDSSLEDARFREASGTLASKIRSALTLVCGEWDGRSFEDAPDARPTGKGRSDRARTLD